MHPTAPIRALIADDIPELRTLLRTTLQGRGFELVGEAADGRETLALAVDREPDVVVLDLGMPGVEGPDLIAELRRRAPAVRVVALAAFAAAELGRQALDRGAHACLDKEGDSDQLVATLREVCGRAFGPLAVPPPGGLGGLAGEELERVWAILAAAPVATAVVGPDGRFLKVNPALCALVGHPEAALLAAGYQAVVHPQDLDADLEQLQRLLAGEAAGYQLQQRCRRVDGEAISVLCNTWLVTNQRGQPLHLDGHGRPRYVVRQLVDLREGRHPEDRLAWRATHDDLTGLPDRSLFLDRLEMTLARLGRESTVAAVLVLDLDRFRGVAERFGDDAVDRLLVAVAGRLRSILRPSDTVSRFGSDEFAVLCPDLGPRAGRCPPGRADDRRAGHPVRRRRSGDRGHGQHRHRPDRVADPPGLLAAVGRRHRPAAGQAPRRRPLRAVRRDGQGPADRAPGAGAGPAPCRRRR